jgi:3-phenylpropionate/trans-cinnamate dioxygenase ferredoxin reductase component
MQKVVIVGAGHAGFQCAAALRQEGFAGEISPISDEGCMPYQRPPLSKSYVLRRLTAPELAFRPESFYCEHRVNLVHGVAECIDRDAQRRRSPMG